MSRGWSLGGINSYEARLARCVCERFGLGMVRFTNSGTEANMMALAVGLEFVKMQQKQEQNQNQKDQSGDKEEDTKKKKKIMVFSNGYHGGTISFPMKFVNAQRAGEDASSANLPHDFIIAPFNNVAETKTIADNLLDSNSSSNSSSSLAIILVEPLQGAGGCRPASRAFLTFLRHLADQHSALLVVDEVMTSRLGFGGLCAELQIRPDLMTLGKWIGGGMSFGAFGGRTDIMRLFDPVGGRLSHAGTFNNNVLSMAGGLAGLEVCSGERIGELNLLGERLKRGVWRVLGENDVISDGWREGMEDDVEWDSFDRLDDGGGGEHAAGMFLTGRGSLMNVRFSGPDSSLWQALFFHHMLGENIYLASRGYMALSIELTEDDVVRFVEAVRKFVQQYHQLLKKRGGDERI